MENNTVGIMVDAEETRRQKAKNLRYKKPIVKNLNLSEDIYLLLEKSAEEIENLYGKETELTEEIRNLLNKLNWK